MRTTKKELERLVTVINNTLEKIQPGGYLLFLQWAYGQPRLHRQWGEGVEDVSPRLPMGKMKLWLESYERGINEVWERMQE